MSKRLIFVVNVDWFFVSHRLPIALAAIRDGYDVHLATRFTGQEDMLRQQGITCHEIGIERSAGGAFSALGLITRLRNLFAELKPDIVHLVTIKPVLLGGMAARMAGTGKVVASISGLGYVFIARGFRARLLKALVFVLYRLALGGTHTTIIVQNTSDESVIRKMVGARDLDTVLIPGSGVDLDRFAYSALPPNPVRVLMVARLLGDKGVREFVGAAQILARDDARLQFLLAGESDPGNPASVSKTEVETWRREGFVEFCGKVDDMPQLISSCHIVALPSYREGMPKALLEAAACGRAVVTTNVPGCRDAIIPEETGLLVKARDAQSLADAIGMLAASPEKLEQMGQAGRCLAESRFDINAVAAAHLVLYGGRRADG